MKGLDTNVLLRLLLADDSAQTLLARRSIDRALDAGETFFVNHIVLCEFVWTLRSTYRFGLAALIAAIERVLDLREFQFEDEDLVRSALAHLRGGNDFADSLMALRNA